VPRYSGSLSELVHYPRFATSMGLLEKAWRDRMNDALIDRRQGSMRTAFGRFKDFIVGNF